MKFKIFSVLLFILFSFNSYSQSTYFIRYKDYVPFTEVDRKVNEQAFSDVVSDLSLPEYDVNYLAKGLGRGDEVLGRIIKVHFADDVDEANFTSMLASDPDIEYIQKSTTYKINYVPNDSLVSQQWALEKIKAFDAWDITQGADTVLLAIIDTGIEFSHPDLQNKIYYNPGENGIDQFGNDKKSNGIDDDGNGFVDDYMGWDFVDRVGLPFDTSAGDFHNWDNMPYDPHHGSFGFHGTFVGGIAGAQANNISGIAGIAPNIKLLNLRAFENGGFGEEDDAAAAILYAVQMGAKVINMSWGDYTFSYVLRDVIRYAYSQNVVLVASSGNNGSNQLHYPSGYDEVISVGASNENDGRASFSVYGSTLDLLAPGESILSTTVNSGYRFDRGTSAAAPHVSAAAALILSIQNFTNEEVKQIIKSTADDIQQPGWDEQTGAGRLNLFRALSVLAPSVVKFNFPTMDFATNENSLVINATVLSPYFVNYSLQIGTGYNPQQWTSLISNGLNQFSDEDIYTLDLSSMEDNVYTLRLIVAKNDGGTLEERTHFHIMRKPPEVIEVGLGPIYYGDKTTIAGEFLTNQPSVMRLFYRKLGETDFNYITLDGFNTNNQFVKTNHYGFIPKDLVQPGNFYEVYFEAENLAGLKTIIVDSLNNNEYFRFPIDEVPVLANFEVMNYSLPDGNLFHEPMSFFSDNYDEILFQLFYTSQTSWFGLYKVENNNFIKVDSLEGKFPRAFGDFNNNGKKDFISYKSPNIIIDEVINADTFNFNQKYSSPDLFNVSVVDDLNNDGLYEIIQQKDNTSYRIWQIKENLTVEAGITFYKTYKDADSIYSSDNNKVNENILVVDSDNDNKKEIWFLDSDGDLIQYIVNDLNNIVKGNDSLKLNGFSVYNNYALSSGDYDGDGKKDFAILYYRNSIAPSFFLLVVSFENHQPRIITQKVLLDQSAEYSGGLQFNELNNSLRFVDVDNDNKDELILSIFPYAYIFKYSNGNDKIIYFSDERANNFRIFAGDLNKNGVVEIGLKLKDNIKFIEFGNSNRTLIPTDVNGYSITNNSLYLSWNSSAQKFYIYKGTEQNNLSLIDSTTQTEYFDLTVSDSTIYYYAVQAYDQSKPEPLSALSRIIEVYSHTPGKPVSAVSNSNSSVIVTFSEKMKNVIENLQSFEVPGAGFPNSVSPNNQYSYLLSFRDNLPAGEQSLIVKDIKDLYGSPIETDTLTFTVVHIPEAETFYVSSFEIINPYRIKVVFNFEVDEASALNKENYSFEPENYVSSIEVDNSDKRVIYINLDGRRPVGSIGREYRLRIENLKSSNGLTINSGAGSYAVLTSFAKDLSKVYVYPNPSNSISEKITFANLPRRAKILIFNINGERINEIEETDGNGGVDFNLTYSTGEKLGSGIYIYRIVMLDDANNEVDEKIGKFAVVR